MAIASTLQWQFHSDNIMNVNHNKCERIALHLVGVTYNLIFENQAQFLDLYYLDREMRNEVNNTL